MKRKLETQIMMDAISECGNTPWPKLQTAVAFGLKRLRVAKYQERISAKKNLEAIGDKLKDLPENVVESVINQFADKVEGFTAGKAHAEAKAKKNAT